MDLTFLHDDELEKIVLGCMLTNSECVMIGAHSLVVDNFYEANIANRATFNAIKELIDNEKDVDISSIQTQLKLDKVFDNIGGISYLSELISSVTTYQNFEQYVDILEEYRLLRLLVKECNSIVSEATKEPLPSISDFLRQAERNISDITSLRKIGGFQTARQVASLVGARLQKLKGGDPLGGNLTTGFSSLDTALGGFGKGQLIVLAARPGVGKSALALNMCFNIARREGKAIAYFSLEMSNEELMKRLFSLSSGVSQQKINQGFLSKQDKALLSSAENTISNTNMYFEESTNISIDDIVLKCKKLKEQRDDLCLIVVDHIGIIKEGNRRFASDQEKIACFSRELKTLALSLNIPIIVVCHINRENEKKDNKTPQLSEIRGSGAIENDCDKALLLYRPRYYTDVGVALKKGKNNEEDKEPTVKDLNKSVEDYYGQRMEIMISKNRQGPTGKTELLFFPTIGRFDVPTDSYTSSKDEDIPFDE